MRSIYLGIYFQREWLPLPVIPASENVTCCERMYQFMQGGLPKCLYPEAEERLDSTIACYDPASALDASFGCPIPEPGILSWMVFSSDTQAKKMLEWEQSRESLLQVSLGIYKNGNSHLFTSTSSTSEISRPNITTVAYKITCFAKLLFSFPPRS